jgi:ribonuclease E
VTRLALIAALLFESNRAAAHPAVDEARDLYRQADFEGAIAALDRAAAGDGLARDDALELLALRAIARFALGDQPAMERDLASLAAVEPGHHLPAEVPPTVRRAFDRAREGVARPLALEAGFEETDAAVRFAARAVGAGTDLLRRVRVLCRVDGSAWRESEAAPELTTAAGPGQTVECRAEAIGIGGAVLAAAGSEDAPLRHALPAAIVAGPTEAARSVGTPTPATLAGDDDDERAPVWPWAVAGAIVVVAATIALAAVLARREPNTFVEFPAP